MYKKLFIAITINAFVMYLTTYVMIDSFDHLFLNINRAYMSLMMVAPMVVVMLVVMRSMYEKRKLNYILMASFAALFVACFALARTQTPVGDAQFLRSMIPHHSSAIVMCEESSLTNPEIIKLCERIVKTQKEEIAQMKELLAGSR